MANWSEAPKWCCAKLVVLLLFLPQFAFSQQDSLVKKQSESLIYPTANCAGAAIGPSERSAGRDSDFVEHFRGSWESELTHGPRTIQFIDSIPERISLIPTTSPGIQEGSPTVKEWEPPRAGQPKLHLTKNLKDSADGFISHYVGPKFSTDVISLIIDERDLFDDSLGIFVPGIAAIQGEKKSGNYYNKGKAWEKAGQATFLNVDGNRCWDVDLGVRTHGDLNRAAPQKSLRFYLRNRYGASGLISDFFPECPIDTLDHLVFKSANNSNNGSHFTDVFIYESVQNLRTQGNYCRPVQFFINGEYWGLYHMRLRQNKKTFKRLDLTRPDSLFLIDNTGLDKDWGRCSEFDELVSFCNQVTDFTNENYDQLDELIDLENIADYLIVNSWFGNRDWVTNNVLAMKPAGYGKWEYVLSDLEATMLNAEDNMFANIAAGSGPHAEIMQCLLGFDQFRKAIQNRYYELQYKELDPVLLKENLAQKRLEYTPAVELHRSRWAQFSFHDDWHECVRTMEEFITKRDYFYTQHLDQLVNGPEEKKTDWSLLISVLIIVIGAVLLFASLFGKEAKLGRAALGVWLMVGGVAHASYPELMTQAALYYPRFLTGAAAYASQEIAVLLILVIAPILSMLNVLLALFGLKLISSGWDLSKGQLLLLSSLPVFALVMMPTNLAGFFILAAASLFFVRKEKYFTAFIFMALGLVFSPWSALLLLASIICLWQKVKGRNRAVAALVLCAAFIWILLISRWQPSNIVGSYSRFLDFELPSWPIQRAAYSLTSFFNAAIIGCGAFGLVLFLWRKKNWALRLWSDNNVVQISWIYFALSGLAQLAKGEPLFGGLNIMLATPMFYVLIKHLSSVPAKKYYWWIFVGFIAFFLVFESYWHIQAQLLFALTALALTGLFWTNTRWNWLNASILFLLAIGLMIVQYQLLIMSLHGNWIG